MSFSSSRIPTSVTPGSIHHPRQATPHHPSPPPAPRPLAQPPLPLPPHRRQQPERRPLHPQARPLCSMLTSQPTSKIDTALIPTSLWTSTARASTRSASGSQTVVTSTSRQRQSITAPAITSGSYMLMLPKMPTTKRYKSLLTSGRRYARPVYPLTRSPASIHSTRLSSSRTTAFRRCTSSSGMTRPSPLT